MQTQNEHYGREVLAEHIARQKYRQLPEEKIN